MFYFFKNGNKKAKTSYQTVNGSLGIKPKLTGRNVKIGIIDWLFGDENSFNFAGRVDLTKSGFLNNCEHGFAMASTLKEIAPDSLIYAINGINRDIIKDDQKRVEILEKAVLFAIENNIKILTHSHAKILDETANKKLDKVLKRASKNGIITIFLHCENKENLCPVSTTYSGKMKSNFFKIFEYDFNFLNPVAYEKWIESNKTDNTQFLSWSSMGVILAGFVALMLEKKPELTQKEIISLLNSGRGKVVNIFNTINLMKKQ